jgi:hypothetical protein
MACDSVCNRVPYPVPGASEGCLLVVLSKAFRSEPLGQAIRIEPLGVQQGFQGLSLWVAHRSTTSDQAAHAMCLRI